MTSKNTHESRQRRWAFTAKTPIASAAALALLALVGLGLALRSPGDK